MADGVIINAGTGGADVRTIIRSNVTTPNVTDPTNQSANAAPQVTQVVAWDLGGASGNNEFLLRAGPLPAAQAVPVVMAYDSIDYTAAILAAKTLKVQVMMLAGSGQFVPCYDSYLAGELVGF